MLVRAQGLVVNRSPLIAVFGCRGRFGQGGCECRFAAGFPLGSPVLPVRRLDSVSAGNGQRLDCDGRNCNPVPTLMLGANSVRSGHNRLCADALRLGQTTIARRSPSTRPGSGSRGLAGSPKAPPVLQSGAMVVRAYLGKETIGRRRRRRLTPAVPACGSGPREKIAALKPYSRPRRDAGGLLAVRACGCSATGRVSSMDRSVRRGRRGANPRVKRSRFASVLGRSRYSGCVLFLGRSKDGILFRGCGQKNRRDW